MAPIASSTASTKRKSTTASSRTAKKAKSNLGTTTRNRSASVQTEEEEEQDFARQGISQVIISDEEGNITSVKDISSEAPEEVEDDEAELSQLNLCVDNA
jgi:hypothetical protein